MSDHELILGAKRRPNYTFRCEHCGKERSLYKKPSDPPRRHCSRACNGASKKLPVPPPKPRDPTRHWNWAGDAVSEKGGRSRALRKFRNPGTCEMCGAAKVERHHKDGNTANNDPSNIAILCRRCHMQADGRLAAMPDRMRAVQPLGVVARWK